MELLLSQHALRLVDNFAGVLKLRVSLWSPDGALVHSGHGFLNSSYCTIMQRGLFGLERCVRMDEEKRQECARLRSAVCYRCHAGLREAVAPILAQEVPVGFVQVGQFRTSSTPPREVLARCASDRERQRVARAFAALPCLSDRQIDDILGLFVMLTDYIVGQEMVSVATDWVLERITRFLDTRHTQPVSLPDLARFVGRSESSVSHLLRGKYGKTFKQMLNERRLAEAEELLKTRPEMSIGEAAALAGFEDRYYFSRVYRQYRKTTPGAYRQSLGGNSHAARKARQPHSPRNNSRKGAAPQ